MKPLPPLPKWPTEPKPEVPSTKAWLRFEDAIIENLTERISDWERDGRKPALTYFTSGLERAVATLLEREHICRSCSAQLSPENYRVADGCPCNSQRGINHGLVPENTCTCKVCDPAQTGSTRYPVPTEQKPPIVDTSSEQRLLDKVREQALRMAYHYGVEPGQLECRLCSEIGEKGEEPLHTRRCILWPNRTLASLSPPSASEPEVGAELTRRVKHADVLALFGDVLNVDASMKERADAAETFCRKVGFPWPPWPNARDEDEDEDDPVAASLPPLPASAMEPALRQLRDYCHSCGAYWPRGYHICCATPAESASALEQKPALRARADMAEAERDARDWHSGEILKLRQRLEFARAEVEMLRGVGCCEDGDGPCGACLQCARTERDDLRSRLASAMADRDSWHRAADAAEASKIDGMKYLQAKLDAVTAERDHERNSLAICQQAQRSLEVQITLERERAERLLLNWESEVGGHRATLETALAVRAERDRLASANKALEGEAFALRDGLRGWKEIAAEAEARAVKAAEFERIVWEVSSAVDEHDRHLTGTLAERVQQAMTKASADLEAANKALTDDYHRAMAQIQTYRLQLDDLHAANKALTEERDRLSGVMARRFVGIVETYTPRLQEAVAAWRALSEDARSKALAPMGDYYIRGTEEDGAALTAMRLLCAAADETEK